MPELGHSSASHGLPSPASEKVSDENNNTSSLNLPSFMNSRGLLLWARQQTQGYKEVNLCDLTTSWRDGLAFCAIIHRFRPDLIDFDRLSKDNFAENNEMALTVAERHLGILALLDVADVVDAAIPDKLSVITFVSQLYHNFKDKTPANQGYATKMSLVLKQRAETSSVSKSKRSSPGHQIYALSGTAKRMATALRNVFRSDQTKDEQHNQQNQSNSAKNKDLNAKAKRSDELSPILPRLLASSLGSECFACGGKVFMVERLVAEKKLFHRSCFKCNKCGGCLRPGTYQYYADTEEFYCLFNCQRENIIRISMKPTAETIPPISDTNMPLSPLMPGAQVPDETSSMVPRQFNVVKKNVIQLPSLPRTDFARPRSNSDELKRSRSHQDSRRVNLGQSSRVRKTHSRSKSLEPRKSSEIVQKEQNAKHLEIDGGMEEDPVVELSVNGTILKSLSRSSSEIEKIKKEFDNGNEESQRNKPTPRSPRQKTKSRGRGEAEPVSNLSLDHDCRKISSEDVDQSSDSLSFKDELMKRVGTEESTEYDSSVSEERKNVSSRSRSESQSKSCRLQSEAPKNDSVKKLREKFLKIDDMLEEKQRYNYKKKQQDLKRELRSVAAWKQLSEDVQGKSRNKKGRFRVSDLERTRGSNVQRLKNKYLNEVAKAASPTKKSSVSSDIVNDLPSSSSTASQVDGLSDQQDSTSSINAAVESLSSANGDSSEINSVGSNSDMLNDTCQDMKIIKQTSGKHDDNSVNGLSHQPSPKRPRKLVPCEEDNLIENCHDNTIAPSGAYLTEDNFQESPPGCPDQITGSQASPKLRHKDMVSENNNANQNEKSSKAIKQIEINFISPSSKERRPSFSSIKYQDNSYLFNSPSCSPSSSPKGSPILSRRVDFVSYQETCNDNQNECSDLHSSDVHIPQSPSNVSLGSGTSSSCSSPRMSIIIAQEPSSTKINSRYFTVETCSPEECREEQAIFEENDMGMDVEGEFRFDSENSRQRKAERKAFRSLQKGVKLCSEKSSLIKDEEIKLSQSQIEAELQALEMMHNELEERGVTMEKILRSSIDFTNDKPLESEEEIIREWLTLVHEKNIIMRRESELIYILQFRNYEDRYRAVESELRHLVSMRDEVKSSDEMKRERELLTELLELVQKRSFVIESLDEDRLSEKQEDDQYKLIMKEGVPPPPLSDRWEQQAEYTKVAFSRFYC